MLKPQIESNKVSYLFTNCKPVKGASRSIIYDIQRETYTFIPNQLYELIKGGIIAAKKDLYLEYGKENMQIIDEYFDFLIEQEYIYQTDNPEFFVLIETTIENNFFLQDAILERDSNSNYDLNVVFKQLEDLNCQHLELRYYNQLIFSDLEAIAAILKQYTFKSIVLVIQSIDNIETVDYSNLIFRNQMLMQIIIYGSSKLLIRENKDECLIFVEKMLLDNSCCGEISPYYFRISLPHFEGNKNSNSCLDKKISIDVNGYFKNCPSINGTYGHVSDTKINEVIIKKEFKNLWQINKDQIAICQDCEFRYMCSDCRAYIKDNSDIYSKPSKCTYDPYQATW
jgi:SPASM domain peptide maturase of grasp-with-spasm system